MTNEVTASRIEAAVPTLDELHPDVTARQKELVQHLAMTGDTQEAAAAALGTDRSWVSKTLRKPHVQQYAHDLARVTIGTNALRAVATVEELLLSRSDRVRLEAAQDIMNRAGLHGSKDVTPPVSVNIKL